MELPGRRFSRSPRRFLLALVAMPLVVWGGSFLGSGQDASPYDRYIRMGGRHGPEAIRRDLEAAYPAGTLALDLVHHLEASGFNCSEYYNRSRDRYCFYQQVDRRGKAIAQLSVTIRETGGRLDGVKAVIVFANTL